MKDAKSGKYCPVCSTTCSHSWRNPAEIGILTHAQLVLAICFCAHVIPCHLKTQNSIAEFLTSIISPFHVLLIFRAKDDFVLFQSHQTRLSPWGLIHHQKLWQDFYVAPNTANVQFKDTCICVHTCPHTQKRCVYINLWVHTHRNKRSFIMFSFKNNFSQWHCKICLAYNQESAPA